MNVSINRKDRVITVMERKTAASQHYRDDNNPNQIMRRYNSTGQITGHYRNQQQQFIDCGVALQQFEDAREMSCQVEANFNNLPVKVRAAFDYSPSKLLQAMENPEQRTKLEKLGVLKPVPPAKPPETPPEPPKK